MKQFPAFEKPVKVNALICFTDFANFSSVARKLEDPLHVMALLQDFADINNSIIGPTNGHIVKYMGDSSLIIFPDELVDEGVNTLIQLKMAIDSYIEEKGHNLGITFSMHYGELALGRLAPIAGLDVMGSDVNVAATISNSGGKNYKGQFVMSPQVFRQLKPETRKKVHKYTPPIVYILE